MVSCLTMGVLVMTVKIVNIEELRKKFKWLKLNGEHIVGDKWMDYVRKLLKVENPSPEDWIVAAESVTMKCNTCVNGTYYWGACVNGVMTCSAPCYRCLGKGYQNKDDFQRNRIYDNHRKIY